VTSVRRASDGSATPLAATARLEAESARRLGARHAVAFAYGRHALAAILEGVGAVAGDRVVVSPLNCTVVPLVLRASRLVPVYAEISARTLNLDAGAVAAASAGARAVVFQHTYGSPEGVRDAAVAAAVRGIALIEDCAHCLPLAGPFPSPGATGRAAIFSNNLRKPLPAASGGLAVTGDEALAAHLAARRDGLPRRSTLAELGLSAELLAHRLLLRSRTYWPLLALSRLGRRPQREGLDGEIDATITRRALRISAAQARRGLAALARIDADARHRRRLCAEYAAALGDAAGVGLPCAGEDRPLSLFPVLVPAKRELLRRARRRLVEIVAWPIGPPLFPLVDAADLARYGYERGSCPVAEDVASRLVGLPTDLRTGPRQRDAVVALLRAHLESR
jgi:dTDP-4-amino-4,6-dideoxygalactose transaminase